MGKKVDRRGFIGKGLAMTAGAAASMFVKPAQARGMKGIRWAEEADVVVLGSGLSGCVTAMTAYDTDPSAKILMVEKMPERFAGGNSRVAGQMLWFPQRDE